MQTGWAPPPDPRLAPAAASPHPPPRLTSPLNPRGMTLQVWPFSILTLKDGGKSLVLLDGRVGSCGGMLRNATKVLQNLFGLESVAGPPSSYSSLTQISKS